MLQKYASIPQGKDWQMVVWGGEVLGPLWLYCKNDYRYTDKELEEWAVKVNEMAREAKALRIYFNNHYEGNAVYTENVPRSGRIGSKGKHADEGSGWVAVTRLTSHKSLHE